MLRDEERSKLGQLVRAARKAKGWNRQRLASVSGVSAATIEKYESGRRGRRPQDEVLEKLARALEIADIDLKEAARRDREVAQFEPRPQPKQTKPRSSPQLAQPKSSPSLASDVGDQPTSQPRLVAGITSGGSKNSGLQPSTGWQYWMDEGRRLFFGEYKPSDASRVYRLAVRDARSPGEKALALSELAHCWRSMNDYDEVWSNTTEALQVLELRDSSRLLLMTIRQLEQMFTDEKSLISYATIARVRSHMLIEQGNAESWTEAEKYLRLLPRIGKILNQDSWQSAGHHFHARLLLEQGSTLTGDSSWREAASRTKVSAAIAFLQRERQLRASHEAQAIAGSWWQEATAHWLLGDVEAAKNAMNNGLQYGTAAAVQLRLLGARMAMAQERWPEAVEEFQARAHEAHFYRAPHILATVLGSWATLHIAAGSTYSQQAIENCVVALIVWPWSEESNEFSQIATLYSDLLYNEYRESVVDTGLSRFFDFIESPISYPFTLLLHMPSFNRRRVCDVDSFLRRLRSRNHHNKSCFCSR